MAKKKNKKVIVIYSGDDWEKKVPFTKESTKIAFEYWHTHGLEKSIEMFRGSIQWYDEKTDTFIKYWAFRNGKWKKYTTPLKMDVIFDKVTSKQEHALHSKKRQIAQKTPFFNDPEFRLHFDNKLNQYFLFKNLMPKTFYVHNKIELKEAFLKLPGTEAVTKPIYGTGGKNIFIDKKNTLLKKRSIKYPCLVQEFIDAKGKNDDLLKDLRIVFVNHKPIYAMHRVAKKGSLFTNFAQGAYAEMVPIKKLSKKVKNYIQTIQIPLKTFPKCHYAIDLIFKKNGKPILMELNTIPGFDLLHTLDTEQYVKKNMNALFNAFLSY